MPTNKRNKRPKQHEKSTKSVATTTNTTKQSEKTNHQRSFVWDGLIADPNILKQYAKVFGQLMRGEFKSADFDCKTIPGYSLYTIKINDKHRALLTKGKVQGRSCQILLELIEEHDYQKSTYLNNPKLIARHIARLEEAPTINIASNEVWQDADFHTLFADVYSDVKSTHIEVETIKPIKWNSGRYTEFVLNPSQENALCQKTPLFISGHAGAGKTSLIPTLVAQAIPVHKKIVCLTTTDILLKNLIDDCEDIMPQALADGTQISIHTWRNLVYTLNPALQGLPVKGEKEFCIWYDEHYKKACQRPLHDKNGIALPRPPAKSSPLAQGVPAYQETRNASGYTLEELLNIGTAKTSTKNYEELVWIYSVLETWEKILAGKAVDFSFVNLVFDEEDRVDLLLLDEGQDLSNRNLKEIARYAKPGMPIIICAGAHQNLFGPFSPIEFIKRLAFKAGTSLQYVALTRSYRVPPNAIALINRILQLECLLVGGSHHKRELQQLPYELGNASIPGSLWWYETIPEAEDLEKIRKAAKSAQFAVITLQQYLGVAQEIFGADLVYTIDQAKGLQFDTVLLYRFMDAPIYGEISELLPTKLANSSPASSGAASSSSQSAHLPKEGKAAWKYAVPCNHLCTATTRFFENLIVVQPPLFQNVHGKVTDLSHLTEDLKHYIPDSGPLHIPDSAEGIGEEAWRQRVIELIHMDACAMARSIYTQKNLGTHDQFDALVQALTLTVPVPDPKTITSSESASVAASSSADTRTSHTGIAPVSLKKPVDPKQKKPVPANSKKQIRTKPDPQTSLKQIFESTQNGQGQLELYTLLCKPDSPIALRNRLTTPQNLLPFLTIDMLFKQLIKHAVNGHTSLLAWFCNENVLGTANDLSQPDDRQARRVFFLETLNRNPTLLKGITDILKLIKKEGARTFYPEWRDISVLSYLKSCNTGKSILTKLTTGSQCSSDEIFHWSLSHLPEEDQQYFRRWLLIPAAKEWSEGNPQQEHMLMLNFLVKYCKKQWLQNPKSYSDVFQRLKDFLKNHIKSAKKGRNIIPPYEQTLLENILLNLSKLPSVSLSDIVAEIGQILQDTNLNVMSVTAAMLAAIRDILLHDIHVEKNNKSAAQACSASDIASSFADNDNALSSEPSSSAPPQLPIRRQVSPRFFQAQSGESATPLSQQDKTQHDLAIAFKNINAMFILPKDGSAPLYPMLQEYDYLDHREIQQLYFIFNNQDFHKQMTVIQWFNQLHRTPAMINHSFFAWLCKKNESERHAVIISMLIQANENLKKTVTMGLQCLLNADYKDLYADLTQIIYLKTTASGRNIITMLAQWAQCSTEDLLKAATCYYPHECFEFARYLHTNDESKWDNCLSEHKNSSRHANMVHVKNIMQRLNCLGKKLWESPPETKSISETVLSIFDRFYSIYSDILKTSEHTFILLQVDTIQSLNNPSFSRTMLWLHSALRQMEHDPMNYTAGLLRGLREQCTELDCTLEAIHRSPESEWDTHLDAFKETGILREFLEQDVALMRIANAVGNTMLDFLHDFAQGQTYINIPAVLLIILSEYIEELRALNPDMDFMLPDISSSMPLTAFISLLERCLAIPYRDRTSPISGSLRAARDRFTSILSKHEMEEGKPLMITGFEDSSEDESNDNIPGEHGITRGY